jgi:hypothetical protein
MEQRTPVAGRFGNFIPSVGLHRRMMVFFLGIAALLYIRAYLSRGTPASEA